MDKKQDRAQAEQAVPFCAPESHPEVEKWYHALLGPVGTQERDATNWKDHQHSMQPVPGWMPLPAWPIDLTCWKSPPRTTPSVEGSKAELGLRPLHNSQST